MLRDFIIGIFPIAITCLLGLLILVKILTLVFSEVRQNFMSIFMRSFLPYSKQAIRNTFNKQLQAYQTLSNKVNKIFYIATSSFTGTYLLMELL